MGEIKDWYILMYMFTYRLREKMEDSVLNGNKYPMVLTLRYFYNFSCFNAFRCNKGKEYVTLSGLLATCLLIVNTSAQATPSQHGEIIHVLGKVSSYLERIGTKMPQFLTLINLD
jgi:hypothetical protein